MLEKGDTLKKIISIVAVIAAITACFCIVANAQENDGYTLTTDTVITLESNPMPNRTLEYNISFNMLDNGQWVRQNLSKIQFSDGTITIYKIPSGIQSGVRYNMVKDNQIIILAGQTITESDIEYLEENTDFVIPYISPLQGTVENTKTAFSAVLFVGSLIISWLVTNQICLVGLYLYIMIAISATARRFIKGA